MFDGSLHRKETASSQWTGKKEHTGSKEDDKMKLL